MSSQLSSQDREQIDKGIREKYHKVSSTPEGHFKYPTGLEGLKGLGYRIIILEPVSPLFWDSGSVY